jgi:hypothetical protein
MYAGFNLIAFTKHDLLHNDWCHERIAHSQPQLRRRHLAHVSVHQCHALHTHTHTHTRSHKPAELTGRVRQYRLVPVLRRPRCAPSSAVIIKAVPAQTQRTRQPARVQANSQQMAGQPALYRRSGPTMPPAATPPSEVDQPKNNHNDMHTSGPSVVAKSTQAMPRLLRVASSTITASATSPHDSRKCYRPQRSAQSRHRTIHMQRCTCKSGAATLKAKFETSTPRCRSSVTDSQVGASCPHACTSPSQTWTRFLSLARRETAKGLQT